MSNLISYIYFDVDNNKTVSSLDELKNVYFKGKRDVYEHIYPTSDGAGFLHAMSTSDVCEMNLFFRFYKLKKDQS